MNHDPAGPGLDTGEFLDPTVVRENVLISLGEALLRITELEVELVHLIELRHSESHTPEGSLKPVNWTDCERVSCRRVKAVFFKEDQKGG